MTPVPPASQPEPEPESTALLAEAKKRLGDTLRGKWKLERILGVGGMGAVYEARHRNGMRGAVKVLDSALARTRDCRERFLREGRLANEVDHIGAVRVLDDDETEDGSAFLVMELLDGVTLEQLAMMRGGVISPEELVRYAAQVLDTLAAAHARGIVHRDIKPENLFLTEDGIVKILDFGIARMNGLGEATRVTRAGEPIGTPAFMSPEQARGKHDEVDERTDLYSLGATMFNLVTGEPIHPDATTVAELIAAVITRPARPVRALSDVPPALAAVIDRALQFNRDARFECAEEMRAALEAAYLEMTHQAIPATPVPTPPVTLPPVTRTGARRWLESRSARRAAAILVPCTIAAATLFVVGTKADPEPRQAVVAVRAPEPAAAPAPEAPMPIAQTTIAAIKPVVRDVVAPPREIQPVVARTREKETAPAPRVDETPQPSRYSRWSPLYERRR
ncbi:MAG TPA: serine/threonine-protein kinase [Polyangiaceae bacterium]